MTTPTLAALVAELERLDQAATPGEWRAAPYSSVVGSPITAQPDPRENTVLVASVRGELATAATNAALIVALRNALPALLDGVRRLEGLEAELDQAVSVVFDRNAENAALKAENANLRSLLTDCADRLERAIIAAGTDPEFAAIAVAQHRAALEPKPPTWDDLRGAAPGLTAGVPSEDHVRSQRDEWEPKP